jgi:hypothetical protein
MGMGFSFFWIAALLFLSWVECPTPHAQTLPSAQQLFALAPHLSLEEKDLRSFRAAGRFHWERVHLKFELFAEKPDRTALRVLDAKDGTPILWASGKDFLFYDPLADEVVVGSGVPFFVLRMEKEGDSTKEEDRGDGNLKFGFGISTNVANAASGLTLDLKSFWMSVQGVPEVRAGEEGNLLLEGKTAKGGRIIAHIDPARDAGPYKRFELFMPESGKAPFCTLEEIAVNQPSKPGQFDFPKRFLENSGLRIRQMEPGEAGFPLDLGKLVRAIMARMAVHGAEEMKPLVEKMYSRKPDWGALTIRDKRASAILISMTDAKE